MKIVSLAVIAAIALAPSVALAHRHHRPMTDHRRIAVLRHRIGELELAVKAMQARAPITASVNASKHAWPSLSGDEKAALTNVLKTLPKTIKFDIVCNDGACVDLAMDIDDAMEQSGLDSVLDHSLGPLGYGVAIQVNAFDHDTAVAASTALKQATSGRLDVPVTEAAAGTNPPGYVTILIGKYRTAQ